MASNNGAISSLPAIPTLCWRRVSALISHALDQSRWCGVSPIWRFRRNPGERTRRRRFRPAVDLVPGQRPPDGVLIIIDALRRASARRITAVIPISATPGRTANRGADADFRQACRQSDHARRRRPRAHARFAPGQIQASSTSPRTICLPRRSWVRDIKQPLRSVRGHRGSRRTSAGVVRAAGSPSDHVPLAIIDKRRGGRANRVANVIGEVDGRI